MSVTLLFNKLVIDKRYETVIELLQKRIMSSNENVQKQDLQSFNTWGLIFEALLRIVSL